MAHSNAPPYQSTTTLIDLPTVACLRDYAATALAACLQERYDLRINARLRCAIRHSDSGRRNSVLHEALGIHRHSKVIVDEQGVDFQARVVRTGALERQTPDGLCDLLTWR